MFSFCLPNKGFIKVVPTRELTADEYLNIGIYQKVNGLKYDIEFDGNRAPWSADTQASAMHLAIGAQWGAYQMIKENKDD